MKTKYKGQDILDTNIVYLDTIYPVGSKVQIYNNPSFDPNISWVGKWVEVPYTDSEGNYKINTFVNRMAKEDLLIDTSTANAAISGNEEDVVVSRFYFGRNNNAAGVNRYLVKRITNLGTELEFLVRESTDKKEAGVIITAGAEDIRNVRFIANYVCNANCTSGADYLMGLNSTTSYLFEAGFPRTNSDSDTAGKVTNQWPAVSGPLTFFDKNYYYTPIKSPRNEDILCQNTSYVIDMCRRQAYRSTSNSWRGMGKMYGTHSTTATQSTLTEYAFDLAFLANTPGNGWVPGINKYISSSDASVIINSWYNIVEVYERLDKNKKVKVWKRIY